MPKIEKSSTLSKDDQELSITKLSQITGIAKRTAQAMYEIGIHDYADLIRYLKQHSPEQFSQALKEHGVNRGPGLIDTKMWMKQAQLLSQAEETSSTPLKGEVQTAELLPKPLTIQEPRDHGRVFTVSFDTAKDDTGKQISVIRVYDESNGGKEAIFQGDLADSWVNWILERANLLSAMKPITLDVETDHESLPIETTTTEAAVFEELNDFLLEITDVHVSVIGRKLAIPEKKIKVEIAFQLSGADAEKLTLQTIFFRSEVYAINLSDGFPIQIGAREDQFEPHVFGYSYQFEVAIPAVGRYELHSVVHLLPSNELRAYHQGPIIKVTP
jgi:uncharacterized short protein YbdD (DUF466 family)